MLSTHQSPSPTTHADRPALLRSYLGYVGYFVGAGLISGGIVHHPIDPRFYSLLVAVGVLLFLAATVLNEVFLSTAPTTPRRLARLVGASLLLSFGIGMFSGGIQHFIDFPERAATLIPLGIALSFGAYLLRFGWGDQGRRVVAVGAVVLVVAAIAFVGLQAVADSVVGGSHDHGSHEAMPASVSRV